MHSCSKCGMGFAHSKAWWEHQQGCNTELQTQLTGEILVAIREKDFARVRELADHCQSLGLKHLATFARQFAGE